MGSNWGHKPGHTWNERTETSSSAAPVAPVTFGVYGPAVMYSNSYNNPSKPVGVQDTTRKRKRRMADNGKKWTCGFFILNF